MKIDFHAHTYYSYDSLMKPEKILRIAKKRGLDGIVICDHNTIKGGIEAKKINKDKNFILIVGAEIATDAGDITGIFLTREIESRDFENVVKEIKAQNGKVILNHPFKGHDLSKIDLSEIDFIEGYNSRLNNEDNQKAIQLAKINNIPVIAGSDAHLYNEIANCKTTVKDLESLIVIDLEYKPSRQRFVTLSQYIKAVKKKNIMIFISATIIQVKYSTKQWKKAIKTVIRG
jgi:hypothetical protein